MMVVELLLLQQLLGQELIPELFLDSQFLAGHYQLDSTASATLTAGANAGEAILDVTLPPLSETLPVSVTVSVNATYVENADGTTSIDVANQEASGVPIPGVFVSGTGNVSGNTLTADVTLSGVVSRWRYFHWYKTISLLLQSFE